MLTGTCTTSQHTSGPIWGVGAAEDDGERAVHSGGEVQDGQVECSREVGASVQDGAGEPAGARRKRKKGEENDDAQETASRTDRSSFSEVDSVRQVDQLETDQHREMPKRRIIEKEGGRKVP